MHPRFGHLCARSIPARLQLAALYAATGSLLPEPLSRLTGAQQAMALLRQCWGVRPLAAEDVQLLQDAAALGGEWLLGLQVAGTGKGGGLSAVATPQPKQLTQWDELAASTTQGSRRSAVPCCAAA